MALLVLVSTCDMISGETQLSGVVHFSGREFAGAETCAACHAKISDSHGHTPHSQTSAATPQSVKGSFDSGENVLIINERLKVVMERTDSGLFQKGFVDGKEIISKPFDITVFDNSP